jgi:dTDP-4-amino-4,6-dideoxygalactose transaminase
MERSALVTAAGTGLRHEQPYEPLLDFALGDPWTPPSVATRFLLPRIADPEAAARRRMNYEAILRELGQAVPAPFGVLPEGASPFAFLFETERREEVVRRFQANGIGAYPFWLAFHPATPAERFPEIVARRRRTAALPVHQELTPAAVGRIVAAAPRALRG